MTRTRTEQLVGVPAADLERVLGSFRVEGATVSSAEQPDGTFVVTAVFAEDAGRAAPAMVLRPPPAAEADAGAATALAPAAAPGISLGLGDTGAAVTALQQALLAAGFPPGAIDGEFGAGTEAAVVAFQRSAGLLPDGVAGPRTLAALAGSSEGGAVAAIPAGDATAAMTVQMASRMLPGARLDNIKKHLPLVLDALRARALTDRRMVLMAITTIAAETAGFVPIDEGLSRFNTSPGGHPFDLYDNRADLGNRGRPDGDRYKGRGFVQLTGRDNYTRIGGRLAQPLQDQPELANDPDIAAQILAEFLKTKETAIKEALIAGDLREARRLVNGGRHGLAVFTAAYETGNTFLA